MPSFDQHIRQAQMICGEMLSLPPTALTLCGVSLHLIGLHCIDAQLAQMNIHPSSHEARQKTLHTKYRSLVVCPESPLGLSEQSECGKLVCPTSLEAARPVRCPQLGQEALGCLPPKLENL
jgi:hypothetical protein